MVKTNENKSLSTVLDELLRLKPPIRVGSDAVKKYRRAGLAPGPVESGGGRFLWMGKVDQVVIGDTGERFDAAALVEYPSRSGFIEMAMKAEQTGISGDRAAGLDSQWLFASTTGFSLVEDRANDQADD